MLSLKDLTSFKSFKSTISILKSLYSDKYWQGSPSTF